MFLSHVVLPRLTPKPSRYGPSLARSACLALLMFGCGGEQDVTFGKPGGAGGTTTSTLDCEPAAACIPAYAMGEAPCATCLIDDLEDGDGFIRPIAGRVGPWYGYERNGSIVPVGSPIAPSALASPRGMSTRAMHVTGQNDGLVLLGVDLSRSGDSYGTIDASQYDGITFWVKNDGPSDLELSVLVATAETTNEGYAGLCSSGCDPAFVTIVLRKKDWTGINVPWTALGGGSAPFSPTALTHVQFVPGQGPFDFWVDDLSFF